MNLGVDREETAADRSSQSVDADAMVTWAVAVGWRTLFSSEETDSC